jgi:hypothetical protein
MANEVVSPVPGLYNQPRLPPMKRYPDEYVRQNKANKANKGT